MRSSLALASLALVVTLAMGAPTDGGTDVETLKAQLAAALQEKDAALKREDVALKEKGKLSKALSDIHPSSCRHLGEAGTSSQALHKRCRFLGEVTAEDTGLIFPNGCPQDSKKNCYAKYENMACQSGGDLVYKSKNEAVLDCDGASQCTGIHQVGPGSETEWSAWKFCINPRQDWTAKDQFHVFAKQGPVNAAKCAGPAQDHRQLTGVLDCSEGQTAKQNWGGCKKGTVCKGDMCVDNLSSGFGFVSAYHGNWCQGIDWPQTIGRGTFQTPAKYFPGGSQAKLSEKNSAAFKGVITKLVIAHPHSTDKRTGAIAMKRVRCVTNANKRQECAVYRVGFCIQMDKDYFTSFREQEATDEQLAAFGSRIRATHDPVFKNAGTHYAELNEKFRCSSYNQPIVDSWISMV